MNRLASSFVIISLLLIGTHNLAAQVGAENGKVLFQNALFPIPAGPGKIAFLRVEEKTPGSPLELFVGDLKTKTETRALPGVDFRDMPTYAFAWSPDGTEFIVPQKAGGCWELFRFKSGSHDGEQLTNLIQYRDILDKAKMIQLGLDEDMMLAISEIAYSPSGKKLIFTMTRPGKTAVWSFDLLSKKTRQVTENQIGYSACFFPDEDRICYTATQTKEGMATDEDILARRIASGKVDTLVMSNAMEFGGVISPNGKYLAYDVTKDNCNNIYVKNLSSGQSQQFTFVKAGKNCTSLHWSPDGSQIVFQGSGFFNFPAALAKDFTPF